MTAKISDPAKRGRGPDTPDTPEIVARILAGHAGAHGALIAVLEEVQSEYGYLPEAALRAVADPTGRSLVAVYAVATFYRSFSLEPRGKRLVSACLGTACHVRGSAAVVEEFERQLGIKAGETTPDREFTLETMNCLGACALGPVVVIDGHYFSRVRRPRVKQLIDDALAGLDRIDLQTDKRVFPIKASCPRCSHSLMDEGFAIDGRPSIRVAVSFDGNHGWLRLSSLYGSFAVAAEHEIPKGAVVDFFCPHCRERLAGSWYCPTCGAQMVPMTVDDGVVVQVCSRRGCRSHMLDLG